MSSLDKKQLEDFFEALGKQLKDPAEIYLTGGIAAWYWGGVRSTADIDFALRASSNWEKVESILLEISQSMKIPLQFSEDISRWGLVGYREFMEDARLFGKWGLLDVYVLSVPIWSVGKLNRYEPQDIEDLEVVFKKQQPSLESLIEVWVKSLQQSPRSSASFQFIKRVEDFLKNYGKEIWGQGFELKKIIEKIHQQLKR